MMKNVGVLAAAMLALIAAAACVPFLEPSESGILSTAASNPVATPATPATSGSADSETPAPLNENVAVLGFGRASTRDERGQRVVDSEAANLAIDGNLKSSWNSQHFAPQWFSVVLDDLYLVDRIQLVVSQTPAGPTTHEVWLADRSGAVRTLYKRLSIAHTQDGQTLDLPFDPPRSTTEVLIFTLDSPSWVAWREVRVFSSLSEDPTEGQETPKVALVEIARGFELPVQITNASDGSGRLFVAEQTGRIRVVRDGVINDTLFLDLSDRISCCGERGLIGIAFPPDYPAKQHFYVSYTNVDGHTIVSRYATTSDPDRADPDSEEILLTIDQPYDSHNGGRIVFGPKDGYLYIGSGDGGSYSYHENNSQDPNSLLGKILRLDVESGVTPYAIPAGNPFAHVDDHRDEIWALGLRNPWGFAFDHLTGDLYIPDVGNSQWEEVNYQPAESRGGENYGWRIMESNFCIDFLPKSCSADGLTLPVAEYSHQHGCAIVGGAVYRGVRHARLQGVFIFADFCTGRIWGLHRPDPNVRDAWQSTLLANASVPVSSIGEDEEGNVYITGYQDGTIFVVSSK